MYEYFQLFFFNFIFELLRQVNMKKNKIFLRRFEN